MTETNSESPLAREIRANWPALSFHYGLSFTELRQMPRAIREIYAEQLPEFLASQQLRAIQAAAFPWSDDETRAAIMDDLQAHVRGETVAYAPIEEASAESGRGIKGVPKPSTESEMAMLAIASGTGFVKEPGKHSEADYEGQLKKLAQGGGGDS